MFRNLHRVTTTIFLLTLFAFSQNYAQLSGSYTIPGTPFATIKQAVDSLNLVGVGGGGVTFNVTAGYTEATVAPILLTATGSAGNPIVFQSSGGPINPKVTRTDAGTLATSVVGGQGDAVIIIDGSDYVVFNGIDVATTNQGIEYGYYLRRLNATDGCKYVTIMNCIITLTKGTSGYVAGIYSSNNDATSLISSATGITLTSTGGRTENLLITGNTIQNVFAGILLRGYNHSVSPYNFQDQNNTVGMPGFGNTIQNYAGNNATAAWGVYMIYQTSPNVSYNTINNAGGGGANATSTLYGIFFSSSNAGGDAVFNNNYITLGQGTVSGAQPINISPTCNSVTANNNIFNFGTFASTSSSYMIYCSNGTNNITCNGNANGAIVKTGAGSLYGFYDFGSPTGGVSMIANNNFSNITLTGASSFYGIYFATGTSQAKTITGNTITNISGSTSAIYGIYTGYDGAGTQIYLNTVTGLTSASTVYGYSIGNSSSTGPYTCYRNDSYNLTSTAGTVYGMYLYGNVNGYRNNIYNLSGNAAASLVYGLYVAGGTTVNLYNNFVSDLRATLATSTNAISGIYISGGTTVGAYYNTVYLNATTTSATTFGTSGLYASTTPTVDLRNNIIDNVSAYGPTGGQTVAYRRSSTTLTTYAAASNNNDFYAGPYGITNLIFSDGTNLIPSIVAYRAFVGPTRDAASFTENPPFANVIAPPYNLHMNTLIPTQCESGGTPVSAPLAITDDFDAEARNALTPDVGADEFAGQLLDINPPSISYTPLLNTSSFAVRNITVTVTDPSGVPNVAPGWPILYWKIDWNGLWNFAAPIGVAGSDYTYSFGGGVATGDTVYYYVCAQDNVVPNPNVGAYPSAGASGFTANPPAAAFPPTTPSKYVISSVPLAGDYTVGITPFNQITGKHVYFQKVVQKVMKEVDVVVPESPKQFEKGKEPKPADKTSFQPKTVKQLMQVEEVTWVPMENGKPYTGDLYVKKSENPQYNYPKDISGTYATITAAVADLNLRGVSAAVNFLLTDASYPSETYPIVVNVVNVSKPTALNTVTIKPNTGVTSLIQGTSASSQIIKILTSYVNIDGSNAGSTDRSLTIQNLSATSPQVIVIGSTGTTPITGCSVKNCIVINGATTSSAMVVSDGTSPGTAGYFTNITIQNNSIQLAYIGLYCTAVPLAGNGNGLNIADNSVNTSGANAVASVGLYVQGVDGATVTNNDIENFVTTTTYYRYGIWFATGTSNSTATHNIIANLNTSTSYYPFGITATPGLANANITIAGNTIDNFTCTSSGDAATGIYAGGASGGIKIQKNLIYHIYNTYSGGYGAWGIALSSSLTASNIEVSNNMIYDIMSYGYASILYENGIGIFVNTGGGYNIYYNSVRLYTNPTAGQSMCMYLTSSVSTASSLDIRDNIFQNDNTVNSNYCVYSGAANTVFTDINYNDYYAASATNGYVGYLGGNQANLGAWQTATGKDLNSISADPKFISNTDLHIQTGFNVVDAKAQYIASVLSDFDNDVRNISTPDIGADEYIYVPPSVADPTGVSATPISSSQIDVAFTPNGSSNNVLIVWNSTGTFTDPSGAPPAIGQPFAGGTLIFNGTVSPYNHTGLDPATLYYYKLFSYNGSIYSPGVPTSATTLCQIITSFPFAESFDGTTFPPTCWTNTQISGTGLWARVTAGVNPACTPRSGAGMTEYASYDFLSGAAAILVTPQITFPSDNYQVSFWMYRDNGYSSNADMVQVYYNTSSNLTGATLLGTINRSRSLTPPEAADGWYQYTFYVPTASSGNAYIIFDGISAYGNNMFVDDINIDVKPPCPPPTGLTATGITNTTANIGWSGSALVDIDYGTPGHPAGTGTVVNAVSTNPYQITGLSAYTSYDVYVRSNCGGTFSAWVGPLNFTTQINPLSLPYTQTFDAATFPAGWTQQGTEWTVSNTSNAGGSPYEMHSLYSSLFGVTRLIVGPINTSGASSLILAFKHFYDDYSTGLTFKIQSSSDLTTWTDEAYSFTSGGGNIGPETVNTSIANNLGTVTYIAWFVDGDHYEYDNWYVDDVSVTLPLPNDVGTLSIDVPIAVAPGTVTPQATVKNYGTSANSFNVQMTITGGYTSTQTVTNLAPGATQVVTFDNWTAALGAYTVNVCTQLGTDQNTSNDCLDKLIGVATGNWAGGSSYPTGTYLGSGAGYNSNTEGTGYLFSIGGNTNSGLGTECYKYNVTTNTWTQIASLPSGRRVFASAIVGDYLYVIGGSDMSSVYQSTVYKYSIVGDAWTTVASLPSTIGWGKAVGYNNRIYFAGGYDGLNVLSTVYVYDVVANTWTACTSMPDARFGGAFTVTGAKLVYVAGAGLVNIINTVVVGTIDGTDPTLITWTTKANPYPGLKKSVYSEYTGKLTELLKPNTKEIKKGHSSPEAANYPPGTMFRFDAAPWGTDGIIVASGSPSASWIPADPNPCYLYKPDTDTWIPQFDVPYPVLGASLGSVNSGNIWKLIVASGLGTLGVTDTTQIYTDNLGGTTTFQLSVNVSNGWNMVSVPGINPDGQGVNNWWLNHTGTVYEFVPGSGYNPVVTTTPGEGYWMKNSGAQTYNTGDEWPAGGIQLVVHNPINAVLGWNMFGGFEDVVNAAALTTTPPGQIVSIYKFVPGTGYQPAAQIVPGFGYWVKVSSACQISIPDVLLAKGMQQPTEYFNDNWGRITVTDATGNSYTLYAVKGDSPKGGAGVDLDKYELPPLPPAGLFDVRFGSGRVAEDINSGFQSVEMRGITYPVKVKVENMDIRLTDETGKLINTNVKDGEEITITSASINKVMVSGELIPDKYALEQNYPNPFNPSTTIEFSLPENVKSVKLSIYNVLGEKVAELVNGAMLAGKYEYKWNAKDYASGMYIYELRTEKFVSIKKMMLLK